MFWRALSSLGLVAIALSIPLPDAQFHQGGFQPIEGARGPSSAGYSAPAPINSYSDSFSDSLGAPSSGPSKTIYVNVPPAQAAAAPAPIAAGPPRKHYKIVFIRAPAPPPAVQPILPPRTEQKTLIYVLHQRPEAQQQQVIEVPTVKHSPEVFFVQYDNPPTAEELQQLTAGNLGALSGGIGSLPGGLPYSPPVVDAPDFRSFAEAGAGSPNLIEEAPLDVFSPADAPVFFDPQPPAAPLPAAPAAPVVIVDPAFAAPEAPAPSGGVPLSGFGGAPAGGVSLQDAAAIFSDPAPAAPEPAAPVFTPLTVAPEPVGVPLSNSIGNEPSAPVGVSLSSTAGAAPAGGRVGVALADTITPGGSTIAAGVGGPVAPETFAFEVGDAFGQRVAVQRR